jgi:hypothetical protein
MQITSRYPDFCFKVEKGEKTGYPGYEEQHFVIEISVEAGGDQFHIKHADVYLPNLDQFVAEFDKFILDRSRTPYLAIGYDDSYLRLTGKSLDVTLEYHISKEFSCYRYTNSGAFEVDQEYLLQILADLKSLAKILHDGPADA